MAEKIAMLAGGCFWCVEAVFDSLAGVSEVVSGYAGGDVANPSYEQVCTGATGHAEVIRIRYDDAVISYGDLLDVFFALHDPTTLNRQGADVGSQYRSAIFVADAAERAQAQAAIERAASAWPDPIVTAIEEMAAFYPAEAHHQDYFANNPTQGYCLATIPPKLAKLRAKFASRIKG